MRDSFGWGAGVSSLGEGSVSEDDIIYWQDVLELVQAGKASNLKCPFCQGDTLTVTKRERVTIVRCTAKTCGHFIEGRFSAEDLAE